MQWPWKFVRSPSGSMVSIVALVLVAMASAGWAFRDQAAPAPLSIQAPKAAGSLTLTATQWASLTVEPVRRKIFDSVLTSDGTVVVNDNKSVAVYSQFSGRVVTVFVEAGQMVRKGAPLAAILAVEAAQAKSDTAAAAAAEATSLKLLDLAQITERRQQQLFLAEAGAEKDWLQSKADLTAAENTHRAALVALAAAREKNTILGQPASRGPGGAGQTVISAPIDGLVVQRQIVAGQYVNSLAAGGSAPLFTITDRRTVWVVANVSEGQAAHVSLGQPMDIAALAVPGRTWRGRVSWVAPSVDTSLHRIAVRAEIANEGGALKPQMNVTVRLLESQPGEALAIPRSAIVYEGSQAHCFVVTGERTLAPKTLQLGRIDSDVAEVRSGLRTGDQIVTRGALFIDRAAEDGAS